MAIYLYTLHEKSFVRLECHEYFTHQLKHVAPSACDLLSVLWTDYILSEVNSGGGPILGVDIVGWVGPGDSLRAHLDPRSFAVPWMTRRDHSHEGRSHYRPKREKKEKIKEVSVVRFASVNRATRGPRPIECGTRWCGGDILIY
ncbi:hypothetical protein ALC53_04247 [Atta colombica]|uniref:Uncharacterized protein n=1 Tax=Atta colombica TaxID=520822 RepID=A0A151I4Y3_9HYME|nr:hypothetical protein ALC53_04247 [Atta colombica]